MAVSFNIAVTPLDSQLAIYEVDATGTTISDATVTSVNVVLASAFSTATTSSSGSNSNLPLASWFSITKNSLYKATVDLSQWALWLPLRHGAALSLVVGDSLGRTHLRENFQTVLVTPSQLALFVTSSGLELVARTVLDNGQRVGIPGGFTATMQVHVGRLDGTGTPLVVGENRIRNTGALMPCLWNGPSGSVFFTCWTVEPPVVGNIATANFLLWRSMDQGATWQQVLKNDGSPAMVWSTTNVPHYIDVCATPGGGAVAIGVLGGIIYAQISRDSVHWSGSVGSEAVPSISVGTTPRTEPWRVFYRHGEVIATNGRDKAYRSLDVGKTWSLVPSP